MTVPEKIVQFLNHQKPNAFCVDCIRDKLKIPGHAHVNMVCETLALCKEFQRNVGGCVTPGHAHRKSIRAL